MNAQLVLDLRLRDGSSFENFYPGRSREAVARLREAVEALARAAMVERAIFLWGPPGSGRTHLLEAACRRAQALGLAPAYVPLAEAARLAPALLEGLGARRLVCLDDVEAVAGRMEWERALYALCEELAACGGLLVAAARAAPAQLGLRLPDLATRLAWGPVYQLQALGDAERLAALRLRAAGRGLVLAEEAARYILARYPRDMHSLFALLDRLDAASLAERRRVTVPFLKRLEAIENGDER